MSRVLLILGLLAGLAVPAAAQDAGVWERHSINGFSVTMPGKPNASADQGLTTLTATIPGASFMFQHGPVSINDADIEREIDARADAEGGAAKCERLGTPARGQIGAYSYVEVMCRKTIAGPAIYRVMANGSTMVVLVAMSSDSALRRRFLDSVITVRGGGIGSATSRDRARWKRVGIDGITVEWPAKPSVDVTRDTSTMTAMTRNASYLLRVGARKTAPGKVHIDVAAVSALERRNAGCTENRKQRSSGKIGAFAYLDVVCKSTPAGPARIRVMSNGKTMVVMSAVGDLPADGGRFFGTVQVPGR